MILLLLPVTCYLLPVTFYLLDVKHALTMAQMRITNDSVNLEPIPVGGIGAASLGTDSAEKPERTRST